MLIHIQNPAKGKRLPMRPPSRAPPATPKASIQHTESLPASSSRKKWDAPTPAARPLSIAVLERDDQSAYDAAETPFELVAHNCRFSDSLQTCRGR